MELDKSRAAAAVVYLVTRERTLSYVVMFFQRGAKELLESDLT